VSGGRAGLLSSWSAAHIQMKIQDKIQEGINILPDKVVDTLDPLNLLRERFCRLRLSVCLGACNFAVSVCLSFGRSVRPSNRLAVCLSARNLDGMSAIPRLLSRAAPACEEPGGVSS
jgi:hypothetical protein